MENQQSIIDWAQSIGIKAFPLRAIERANEEMKEALDTACSGDYNMAAKEIADVAICLFVAASYMNADLQTLIDDKMKINRARKWRIDESGCAYHIK